MVYRGISARCYQPARRPFRRFSTTIPPLPIVLRQKSPISPHPLSFSCHPKLSSTLSTHSIRNTGETARADAFKTNASCLSASRWSGWLVVQGDIRREGRRNRTERQRDGVEYQKGNIFDCSDSSRTHTHPPPSFAVHLDDFP